MQLKFTIVYPSMIQMFHVELDCIPFKECNMVAESLCRATNSQSGFPLGFAFVAICDRFC